MSKGDKPLATSNRRRFLKLAGTGTLGVTLAGCASDDPGTAPATDTETDSGDGGGGTVTGTPTSSGPSEVVIGSNHPLSGFLASTGAGMSNAIKLAAQRKNEAGGIQSLGGAEVTVIEGDNQGKQELGGQVSEELINDGAHVLTGCFSSPVTTAATQVAERSEVPFVVSVAADDDILQGRGFDYVYRPQPPAKRLARNYADLVPEVIRGAGESLETAGLFYVNNSYGQAIKNHLANFLPKEGIEVVAETALEFGASSANTQASKLKQADPDTVVVTTYAPGGVTLSKALQDIDYRPPFLTACASATFTDEGAIADVGDFANGVMDNNYALNPTIDKTAEVKDQFTSNYDQQFSASVGMAFVAGEVAIQAIENAGTTDREAINRELANLVYEDHIAAMGPIRFQNNGENANALGPVNQVQEGAVRVVYPEEYAEAEPQL